MLVHNSPISSMGLRKGGQYTAATLYTHPKVCILQLQQNTKPHNLSCSFYMCPCLLLAVLNWLSKKNAQLLSSGNSPKRHVIWILELNESYPWLCYLIAKLGWWPGMLISSIICHHNWCLLLCSLYLISTDCPDLPWSWTTTSSFVNKEAYSDVVGDKIYCFKKNAFDGQT